MRFEAIKEVPSIVKGYEEFETIPKGTVCETVIFDGVRTIAYRGKMICDFDSQMAKDYFKQIV